MTKKQVHQDAITTEDATIRTKMPDNDEDSEGTWNEDWDEKENFRFASEAVVVGASVAPAASEQEMVLRLKAEARAYTLREEPSKDRRRMKEQLPPPLLPAPSTVIVPKPRLENSSVDSKSNAHVDPTITATGGAVTSRPR